MTRSLCKPTNQGWEGVAAPVSALDHRMPPDLVHLSAEPAHKGLCGCFAIRSR